MRRSYRVLCLAVAAVTVAALPAGAVTRAKSRTVRVATVRRQPASPCVGDPTQVNLFSLTVQGEAAKGAYVLPAGRPRGLVVMAHGFGRDVDSWYGHMVQVAQRDGVVAVAMSYRHQNDLGVQPGNSYTSTQGWRVQEGADDSVAAAQYFEALCPTIRTIVMYGVSMGGNTSGLAVAAKATRHSGAPLFDYWIEVEGIENLTELYVEASAVALSGNATAVAAVHDIEEETGGTPAEKPAEYASRTVVLRARDIADSGIKGAIVVHAVDDGEAGYNQAHETAAALRALGVPVDLWTVGTKDAATPADTTLDGYATSNVPGFPSLFAGHGGEENANHIVIGAGLDRLHEVLSGRRLPACRLGVIDGQHAPRTAPVVSPATC